MDGRGDRDRQLRRRARRPPRADRPRAQLAAARGLHAVALTFDPHPSAVLASRARRRASARSTRRLELLAAAGLDATVVEPFTHELAAYAADAFVDDIAARRAATRARSSSATTSRTATAGPARPTTLRAHGARAGAAGRGGARPSRSAARSRRRRRSARYLRAGDPGRAPSALLGRRWDLDGTVVHGAKRGRAIGVPTANIAPESDLAIAPGIYAVPLTPVARRAAARGREPRHQPDVRRAGSAWSSRSTSSTGTATSTTAASAPRSSPGSATRRRTPRSTRCSPRSASTSSRRARRWPSDRSWVITERRAAARGGPGRRGVAVGRARRRGARRGMAKRRGAGRRARRTTVDALRGRLRVRAGHNLPS